MGTPPLQPPKGTEALLCELMAVQVRFLVVGGLGVRFYCPCRTTADLDILIESSEANATGVVDTLDRLGFYLKPEMVCRLFAPGSNPQRIDLHPQIPAHILIEPEGFDFMAHWEKSEIATMLTFSVRVASPQLIMSIKSASTRALDARDVALLQQRANQGGTCPPTAAPHRVQ